MITTTWYSECADRGCVLRTASPHDLLAWHLGGDYRKAGAFVSARISRFKITADESDALARRRKPDGASYWRPRDPDPRGPERYRQPF